MAASEGGIFCGTIPIDQSTLWKTLQNQSDVARRQYVTPSKELANGAQVLKPLVDHKVKESGGEPEGRNLVLPNYPTQIVQ
jgi:hypothetical protein